MNRFLAGLVITLASALSWPALAQDEVIAVGTGPGVAGAAQTVTVSGKILAIDKAKREVTLEAEDAEEVVVKAGPEVRNFAELEVGDRVDLEFTRSLTLELRKGSKAPISRTDTVEGETASPGEAPGAAVGHRVVIIAEVTALDPATQTITLKGPNRSLDLTVPDPAQFKHIARGDRVRATFVEAVAVAVTPKDEPDEQDDDDGVE